MPFPTEEIGIPGERIYVYRTVCGASFQSELTESKLDDTAADYRPRAITAASENSTLKTISKRNKCKFVKRLAYAFYNIYINICVNVYNTHERTHVCILYICICIIIPGGGGLLCPY